jgi:CheY-like chemotaxis protein
VKFTERGRVEIEVEAVRPGWLRIKVSDTGIGIGAEAQRRLFKPFTQADGSTARRFGGSGLGLALCRQLVEMMGGSIGMKSAPGEGSTFWAELPLPAAGPGAKPADEGARDRRRDSRFQGARVLLVEDNDVNRLVAAAILARAGIDVVEAVDGTSALRCVEREAGRLDAVLLDIQMPDLDGHEVAAAIRRRADAKSLPIIALTAAALASEREHSLDSGMNDFLTKPIDPDKLFEVLGRWLRPRTVTPGAR